MACIDVNSKVMSNFNNDDISAALNEIIDNELSKDVSRMNTELVDECVNALLELEKEKNNDFVVLVPLLNSNEFIKSLQAKQSSWKSLNVFARASIIAALLAASTMSANAAYKSATGVDLIGNLGDTIHQKLEDWNILKTDESKHYIEQLGDDEDGDDESITNIESTTSQSTTSPAETEEVSSAPSTTIPASTTHYIDQLGDDEDGDDEETTNNQQTTTQKSKESKTEVPVTVPPEKEPEKAYLKELDAEFDNFKYDYIYGEELSYSGLKLTAKYSDGTKKPVSLSDCSYTKNIDMNVTADYTLRIIYKNCVIKIDITVRPDEETRGSKVCENELYEYYLSDKGAYITKYKGSETSIVLDEVDGNAVYAIGANTFKDSNLQFFTAQNVKKVFKNAFKGSKSLVDCNIPEAVYIEDSAFEGCEKLSSAIFSESLTHLGKSVYKDSSIEEIIIPDDITEIPESLCENCKSLKKVTLSKNTKVIGSSAFSECDAIEEVKNTEKIETVNSFGFYNCQNAEFDSSLSKLEKAKEYAFAYCGKIDFGTLNPNISEIGKYAFAYCTKLTEVNLPSSFEIIPKGAFRGAHISTLTLPEGLKEIDDYAFMSTEFRELTVPNSVEKVGTYGLYSVRLRNISFGKNITHMGKSAVFKSTRLTMNVYENTAAYDYAISNNINYTLIDE